MVIEAPIQTIIALETVYLGVISAATTEVNDNVRGVNLAQVERTVREIVEAAEGRPVSYFGPRHWRYSEDAAITRAAFLGGATTSSSDIGAATVGKEGVGTIPHALENIYAWKVGRETAVVEATVAFDQVIDSQVPRFALIDYNNREIDDSLSCARALGERLSMVRMDTCGENLAQGALLSPNDMLAGKWRALGLPLPPEHAPDAKYWYGNGVTITGVAALRMALDENGFENLGIDLTSGFGNPEKVRAFVRAEKILGLRLFDALGVGGVYSPCRAATMDIVAVGETPESFVPMSKVGRPSRPNPRLVEIMEENNEIN